MGKAQGTLGSLLVLGLNVALMVPAQAENLRGYFNRNRSNTYREPYRLRTRSGDDLESRLVSQINSAQKSVWVAVQEIRLPLVAKAIAKQKRAGLDVRVILENSYNYDLIEIQDENFAKREGYHGERNKEYIRFADVNGDGVVSVIEALDRDAVYILKSAGVPLVDDTADGSAGSGLMHHKFLLVDGERMVVTSANFTMSDVHGDFTDAQTQGNANSLLEFSDRDLVKIFSEEFLIMWGDKGQAPKFGVQKPYRPAKTVRLTSGEQVTVQFSGTSRKMSVEESTIGLILRALEKAQNTVNMALFVFSEAEIGAALRTLHEGRRAVEIKALIEPTFAYRFYSKALDMWGLQLLPDNCRAAEGSSPWNKPVSTAGVPQLVKGDFLHHKYAVIDEHTTIMGSHNWSRAAAEGNDETLMVIESDVIAKDFNREFSAWYVNARLGAPEWLVKSARKSQERCGR